MLFRRRRRRFFRVASVQGHSFDSPAVLAPPLRDSRILCGVKGSFPGTIVAFIAFEDNDIKFRAQRFLSSIRNSMETVLKCNVEVRICLMQEFLAGGLQHQTYPDETAESDVLSCSTNSERLKGVLNLSGAGGGLQSSNIPMIISGGNSGIHRTRGQEVSVEQLKSAALDEQVHGSTLLKNTHPVCLIMQDLREIKFFHKLVVSIMGGPPWPPLFPQDTLTRIWLMN